MPLNWTECRRAGALAAQMGDFDDAESHWFCALQEAEDFGETDRRLLITLEDLAELYWKRNKHRQAASLCKRILKYYKATLGVEHPDTGTVCTNLAMICHTGGMLDEAEKYYREALTIKTIRHAHDDEIQALKANYADLLKHSGRHSEAESMIQSAFRDKQKRWKRSGVYEAYVQDNPHEDTPSLEDRLTDAATKPSPKPHLD